jgi:hypothetical protein
LKKQKINSNAGDIQFSQLSIISGKSEMCKWAMGVFWFQSQ